MESTLVIIPYRNRQEHLREFINGVLPLFNDNDIKLLIVEQIDDFDFNRGALLNIGVKELQDMDWYILHDVDTLPNAKIVKSAYRPDSSYDIIQLRRPHDSSLGNICKFSKKSLIMMNGHPNNIWGWGVEDRALYFRYLKFQRHLKLKTFVKIPGWKILDHDASHRKYTKETEILSKYYWEREHICSENYVDDGISTVPYTKSSSDVKIHIYTKSCYVAVCFYFHIHVKLKK